ncbi:DUF4328 domain-containing protein [Nucisporomicrobium flavum]|uniref:DUF4328 domain-containing protein n=1 Tax=Nucisporomicrobium flavum TaxID=2785915 RepID=UPI0018F34392|nr:DUF4328 domain-containing protein [Nucisporomicrobium flavum]
MTEHAPYTYPQSSFVPYSTARPLRTRATVAIVALVLAMVAAALTAALTFFASNLVDDARVTGEGLGTARAVEAATAAGAGLLSITSLLFAGIAFICWLHRARTNLDAFGGTVLSWGAGWTIGAWFVPLGNLVIPILMINEVDRATDHRVQGWDTRRPGRAVFVWWAVLWTAFLILDRVVAVAVLGAADSTGSTALAALSAAVEVGAASAAIGLIRRITAGQEAVLSGAAGAPAEAFAQTPPFTQPAPTSAPFSAAGDSWEEGLASGPIGWDTPGPDRR